MVAEANVEESAFSIAVAYAMERVRLRTLLPNNGEDRSH